MTSIQPNQWPMEKEARPISWVHDKTRTDVAKRAFADGLSGQQTAEIIGGVSRNSVIAFWNRNGMKRGRAPAAPKPPRVHYHRNNNIRPKQSIALRPEKPSPPTQQSRPIAFLDLPELGKTANRCRWPLSGSGPAMICCGADIKHTAYDDPYCQFHRIVSTPQERK